MHRSRIPTWWVAAALALGSTSALAQPSPEPSLPVEPQRAAEPPLPAPPPPIVAHVDVEAPADPASITASPAPPRDRYPRSLAARKPILPPGVVEASALVGLEVPDAAGARERYTAAPRLRIGLPSSELALASALFVHRRETAGPEPHRLGAATASYRYMYLPGATVGAELTVREPAVDARRYAPRLLIGMKQRFGTRAAIDAVVAGGVDHTADARWLAGLGTVRLQAQAAHGLAFEARGGLGYSRRLADAPDPKLVPDYGIRMVAGASPYVDFIIGVDLLGTGATAHTLITAGLAVRHVP